MSLIKLLAALYRLVSLVPPDLRSAVVELISDLVGGRMNPKEVATKAEKLAISIAFKKGYS